MAQSSSAAHQIASRYARALIDTATSAGALESVEKDMTDLGSMLGASSDLQRMISSPAFTPKIQAQAIQQIAEKASFHKLTANFLQVLASNRRLSVLPSALSAFSEEMSKRRGEVKATVQSAVALTPDQQAELQAQLKKSLGANVRLEVSVDKTLLGGLVVTVGSKQIDDSIKSKLAALKQTLASSNTNNILKEVG